MAEVNIVSPIPQAPGTAGVVPHPQDVGESITISGTIIGKDAGGNFLLRTPNGNLALHSSFPLTYNSDVVLRLNNTGAGTNARIVSVNGEAFSEFSQTAQPETDSVSSQLLQTAPPVLESQAQSANPDSIPALVVASTPGTPPSNTAQTPAEAASPQPTLPQQGTAVVIHLPPTPPQAAAVALPGNQVPAGANVLQQATAAPQQLPQTQQPQAVPQIATAVMQNPTEVPSLQLPAQPANVNTNAPQNSVAKETQPVAPQPTQVQVQGAIIQDAVEQAVQTAPSPLYAAYAKQISQTQTQSPASTQLATQIPSAAEEEQPVPAAKFIPVEGQIAAMSKDGTLTVQTPVGQVTLKPNALPDIVTEKLSVGTPVILDLPESQPAGILQNIISALPASFAEIASSWDTVKAIISLLNSTGETPDTTQNQQPASATPSPRIPALGPSFSASSLSFLSALASGDAHKVLGDNVINTLKSAGQNTLVQRFISEVANLSTAITAKPDQPVPTWQAAFLPFVYQGEPQQARIYVKRDAPNKKQQAATGISGGARFVVEVDLSEMGGIQLDGLIRKKQANTIFDLMIRSNTELSTEERADITDIFNSAAEQTGFKGSIAFQTTSDFPVKPLDEILANRSNIIVA